MSQVNQRGNKTGQNLQNRFERAKAGMNKQNNVTDYYRDYGYQIVIGVFIATCLLAVFFTLNVKNINIKTTPVVDQNEIDNWNEEAKNYGYTFQNGENDFFDGWMLLDAKFTMNNIFYKDGQTSRLQLCKSGEEDQIIIPESYNFREEHPDCAAPIQDQGNCSSNYAVIGASTIADRFCLSSSTNVRPSLNSQTYTSCDSKQRKSDCGKGGVLVNFLEYTRSKGLLDEQCFDYNNEDWERSCPDTSECEPYKIFDFCVLQKEENIKREIMTNGPVVTASRIYLDMLTYKSGVYQNVDGRPHKFGDKWQQWKIVGWGVNVLTQQSYWIAEGTWGDSWGEEGIIKVDITNDKNFFGQLAFSPRPRVETIQIDQDEFEDDLEEFEEDDFNLDDELEDEEF